MIKNKFKIALILSLLMLNLLILPAFALTSLQSDFVHVSKDKVINDDFLALGDKILIEGNIKGDLWVFGKEVVISGKVQGDVLGAAQIIRFKGEAHNLRVACQQNILTGKIYGNVNTAAQNVFLKPGTNIEGNVLAAAQNIDIDGLIGGNFTGYSESVEITGQINRNVKLEVGNLKIGSTAFINGSLYYKAPKEGFIHPEAKINKIDWKKKIEITREKPEQPVFPINKVLSTLGFLLIGIFLVKCMPTVTEEYFKIIKEKTLKALGLGFLVLVLTPVVILILAFTVIGLPVGGLLLLIYIFSIYVGQIFFSYAVGRFILEKFKKNTAYFHLLSLLFGTIMMTFLVKIPFIGWFIGLIEICFGLGILTMLYYAKIKRA